MKSIVVINLLYIIYPEHFKFSQQQNILQADLTKPQKLLESVQKSKFDAI